MDRRIVVVVALALAVIAGASIAFFMTGTKPPSPQATSAPATPASPAPSSPVATAEVPGVVPERAAPAPRRRAAPKPESAPAAEAPAPVETAPTTGILRIDSDVAGAQVFIDREYVGVTPLTARDVKPGSHRLNVSAQGYEGFSDTIEVAPGPRDLRINFKDVRLDQKIDVVHKHRMGSCRGKLIATAQGVRYETTNKDDGFSAPLLDLAAFQVDYLEKNLRLTLRGGKRFDFTDPEGNADHLFVFHRDVEKARERLKKGDRPAQNEW